MKNNEINLETLIKMKKFLEKLKNYKKNLEKINIYPNFQKNL